MEKNQKIVANAADLPDCIGDLSAVGDALYAIGGKWKLPIVIALYDGPKRFNELQRCVIGISAKILSSELKDLELNGFIKRNVQLGYPVVIDYEITPYSYSIKDVVQALSQWGLFHRENIRSGVIK